MCVRGGFGDAAWGTGSNKKAKLGQVRCSQCNVDWSTTTTALSEPIDIFCEWVDAAEEASRVRLLLRAAGGW